MFLRMLSTVAFAAGFTATAALADGMPSYSGGYTAPFSWTGFYIGANVGWERKHMVGSDYDLVNSGFGNQITDGVSSAAPTSQSFQGVLGGGQIGYNHQFGRAVIGTELSASWNDVSGSGDCFGQGFVGTAPRGQFEQITSTRNCSERQKWSVNWLNKVGITTGRLLVYLSGGVALTEIEKKRSLDFRVDRLNGAVVVGTREHDTAEWSGEQTHIGVVLGGGLQYAIANNVSLGVEYLRTTYASADYSMQGNATLTDCTDGCQTTRFKFGSNAVQSGSSDTVRAVLNFKFGAEPERVPFK
jgi:outer membrane immunogenic protein